MSKFIIFVLFMVITAFSANATTQNDIAPYFTDIPETNKNSNLQSSIPDLTDSDSLSESNFEPLHLSGVTESLNDRIYRVNETNVYFNETEYEIGGLHMVDKETIDLMQDTLNKRNISCIEGPGGTMIITTRVLNIIRNNPNDNFNIISTVADDDEGRSIINGLKQENISYCKMPPKDTGNPATGKCLVLVTPDGQRTMFTYIGSKSNYNTQNIEPIRELYKNSDYFMIEGFAFMDPEYLGFLNIVIEEGSEKHKIIFLSSGIPCLKYVDNYKDENTLKNALLKILKFVENNALLVIGNESELKMLTSTESALEATIVLQEMGLSGSITRGNEGAIVFDNTSIYTVSAPNLEAKDTTGAGDYNAAGFLSEFIANKNIIRAGKIGAYSAGVRIISEGAQPTDHKEKLRNYESAQAIPHKKIED
ncbi:MAG: PfkB family carbohydrate kinase [Pseudomonadota bacterium]